MANPMTIGILHSGTAGNPSHAGHIQALINGITSAANGQNFTLANGGVPLYSKDDPKLLHDNAARLIGNDVLVAAGGSRSAVEALAAVNKPPGTGTKIVYTSVTDPTKIGVVGPNVTGIRANTSENDAPRLTWLSQLTGIQKIGPLTNSKRPGYSLAAVGAAAAAAAPAVTLVPGGMYQLLQA
jgi:hypothetical protein